MQGEGRRYVIAMPRGWATLSLSADCHPEDAFVARVLRALASHECWSDALVGIAKASAQGVLDELEVEGRGLTSVELDVIVGRSLTLSMQRQMSCTQRAQLVRSLAAALRAEGHAVGRADGRSVTGSMVDVRCTRARAAA